MSVKTKSKLRSHKTRSRVSTKPLLAAKGEVRTGMPRSNLDTVPSPFASMGKLMAAYLEFPAHLAACRSPFDLWLAHMRLAQHVLVIAQSVAFGRPVVGPPSVP